MRDRLTPPSIRAQGAQNPLLPDPRKDTVVDRHYFDRVISITNSELTNLIYPGQYGPFPILTPPDNVARSIVRKLAVVGSPSAYFRTRFYWTLNIASGSVQEFVVDTLTGQNNDVTASVVIPGVQYTPYGYLDDPEPIQVLVKQGAQLQITFFGGDPAFNTDTPNAIIRIQGLHEFGRDV